MIKIKKIIYRWFNHFGYYHIKDMQAGGHCGLCGCWVQEHVVVGDWPWTVCDKCGKTPKNCIVILEEENS